MENHLNQMYDEHLCLWKEQEILKRKYFQIARSREDIMMEYSIIESDLLQEVGFTPRDFEARRQLLFLKECKLDNLEHDLTYKLKQIESKLSYIFQELSKELVHKVA